MKIQELRQLTTKKFWELLKKTRRNLAATKFHVKTGQRKDVATISKHKKTIARILTLLKEQTILAPNKKA